MFSFLEETAIGRKYSANVESQNKEMRAPKRHARKRLRGSASPSSTGTRRKARELANTSKQRQVSGIVKYARRTSPAQKNGNEQPARSLKDNLKRTAQDHNNGLATGQCGQYKKRSSASGSKSTQKHKTHDAGRFLVGVRQKTSGGISSLLEIRHFCACAQQTGGGAIARSAKFSPWSSTRWTQGRR